MTRRVTPEDRELREMSEAVLKAAVLNIAYTNGWIVFHMPMTQQTRPGRRSGVSGYPDLTCARDGEVVWMELKRQDGVLQPEQVVWMQALPHHHVIRPSDLVGGRVNELLD